MLGGIRGLLVVRAHLWPHLGGADDTGLYVTGHLHCKTLPEGLGLQTQRLDPLHQPTGEGESTANFVDRAAFQERRRFCATASKTAQHQQSRGHRGGHRQSGVARPLHLQQMLKGCFSSTELIHTDLQWFAVCTLLGHLFLFFVAQHNYNKIMVCCSLSSGSLLCVFSCENVSEVKNSFRHISKTKPGRHRPDCLVSTRLLEWSCCCGLSPPCGQLWERVGW